MTRHSPLPFDLGSLEVFLAVCENATMAGAARALGLTQPAVSQVIAELEQRMRATLFDRSVRPLGLTPAGAMLRQRAGLLVAEARGIGPLLRELRKGKLPTVRVGFVDSLSSVLIPEFPLFLRQVSEQIALLSGITVAHVDAVLKRRLDVLVGIDDFDQGDTLESWPLIEEPYVVAAPAAAAELRTLDDLRDYSRSVPFIRFSARRKAGTSIERHLRRIGLDLPHGFEFDTPFGVAAMVAAGHGWAITTPLCLLEVGPLQGRLKTFPLPGPALRRRLALLARGRELGTLPSEAAAFIRDLLARKCVQPLQHGMPWADLQLGAAPAPRRGAA